MQAGRQAPWTQFSFGFNHFGVRKQAVAVVVVVKIGRTRCVSL